MKNHKNLYPFTVAQKGNEKFLTKFNIKPCVVKLRRHQELESLLKDARGTQPIRDEADTPVAPRRSARLCQQNQKNAPSKVDQKSVATPKKADQNCRTPRTPKQARSKSVEMKPILAKPGRRERRSKSVSFYINESDSDEDEDDFIARPNLAPARRHSFSNDGLMAPAPSTSMQANAKPPRAHSADGRSESDVIIKHSLNATKENADDGNPVVTDSDKKVGAKDSNESSDKIRDMEARIESLVQSNKSKINRIKLLLDERNQLMEQIETMNRLNYLLTEAVDLYRAEDENNAKKDAGELKAENDALSVRISRLNQTIFDLKEENKKLKDVVATHSARVMGEHNYIL